MSKSLKSQPGFKKRFAWHCCQIINVIVAVVLGYAILSASFVRLPQDYQWTVAFISPFVKDYVCKCLLIVAYKSAGQGSKGKRTVKFPIKVYIGTKHALYLAAVIGGVATPVTSACLMATDFAYALYSGWKLVRKYKKNPNSQAIEGM